MTDDSLKLLAFQQQLEKDVDGSVTFVGLSVSETVHACVIAGLTKKAERVRTDFKIPDKRYERLDYLCSPTTVNIFSC